MSASKHTPGPRKEEDALRRAHDNCGYVTDADFGRMDEAVTDMCAAASLLRSSHDALLEALECIETEAAAVAYNECDAVLDSVLIRDIARAALTTARGEEVKP